MDTQWCIALDYGPGAHFFLATFHPSCNETGDYTRLAFIIIEDSCASVMSVVNSDGMQSTIVHYEIGSVICAHHILKSKWLVVTLPRIQA